LYEVLGTTEAQAAAIEMRQVSQRFIASAALHKQRLSERRELSILTVSPSYTALTICTVHKF
jgi:hypothetical protein